MLHSPATSLVARLAAIALVAVTVQVAAVSQIEILRATADLLPLVCAAVGLLLGSLTGAAFGFGTGLLVDAALYQLMGVSSLIYVAIGFAAGRARELRDPQAPSTPLVAGALATVVAIVAGGVINFLLGMGLPVSFGMLRELASTTVLNALIALPVFSLVRRVLRPVLPEDPRRRRRRSYTTGGLSPLTRA